MKHKAQESFERISQGDYEVFDSSCLVAVEDMDMRYEDDCNIIEDLINCQLTLEEMKFAANCLYAAGFVDENMVKQILGKFQKQRDMWVSEDETN